MELKEYLEKKFATVDLSEDGFTVSLSTLIDYLLDVYVKSEDYEHGITLSHKKDLAIHKHIPKTKDRDILLFNKSEIVSSIVTAILLANFDREFELYISALEAATILLEVVRRPIDDKLENEKWYNALKAKKQGFNDARELILSASKIAEDITGAKDTDIEAHIDDTVFTSGAAERLAKMASDGKKKETK
jgi:hypothetical protein